MEYQEYQDVDQSAIMAMFGTIMFISLALLLIIIVSMWKIFTKAGKPGWAAIVPIYNYIVLLEIINKPVWWIILLIIPLVNIIFIFIILNRLSEVFGQGIGMTLLLIFVPFIGFPMLAFGSAQYIGNRSMTQQPI